MGGLKTVVITDQLQGYIILGFGIFLCSYLYADSTVTFTEIKWINTQLTYSNAQCFAALFIGGAFISIGSHGADQDLLQRVLATRDLKTARKAIILSSFGATAVIILYLSIGILLSYSGGTVLEQKSPLVDFISKGNNNLIIGSFIVLLIAAAMSTLDSAIHSTGAIWKSIFSSHHPGRLWSLLSLIFFIGFAIIFMELAKIEQNFLKLALGSMNYINGGLIGVLSTYIFFPRRINTTGIILSLFGGLFTAIICNFFIKPPVAWTWDDCHFIIMCIYFMPDRFAY